VAVPKVVTNIPKPNMTKKSINRSKLRNKTNIGEINNPPSKKVVLVYPHRGLLSLLCFFNIEHRLTIFES